MIDWECGDTDANVIAGTDDALITGFAQQLAALKGPIFLRWFYEPNFPGGVNYTNCVSNLGPAGYVKAYRHIHDLFEAAGATNVAFVWNIGASGTDHDWIDYYPGAAYVDWITADGYVRTSIPTSGVFSLRFAQWYQTFADFGKPLMITETAAFSGAQQSYLNQIQAEVATEFPLLKGILYFDAFGNLAEYPLDSEGMHSFQSLSSDPFFQPNRTATSTTVDTTPSLAVTGQEVTMTAQVQATDDGGSVSFYDKGEPVTGCQSVALDVSSSCTSTDLATGANAITAVYSGDADNAGSNGAAPGETVMPLAFPEGSAFAGTPDLASIAALSFAPPGAGGSAPADPSRLGSSGGRGAGFDPLGLFAGLFRGQYGFGADAVLVATGLLAICGAYIAGTWLQDQRRRRRTLSER